MVGAQESLWDDPEWRERAKRSIVEIFDAELHDRVPKAVDRALAENELSVAAKYKILKFVATTAGIFSTVAGGVVWALLQQTAADVAESTAEKAVELVTDKAASVAEHVARTEARESATFIRAVSVAEFLMRNEEFKAQISAGALDALKGSVVAFSVPCANVAGWTDYKEGWGRFIIGAVEAEQLDSIPAGFRKSQSGGDLSARPIGKAGGDEAHVLTVDEMPAHEHGIGANRAGNGSPMGWIAADNVLFGTGPGPKSVLVHAGGAEEANCTGDRCRTTMTTGRAQPHSNMPPYVALYLCQKT
jgi:hypothetical protein